MVLGRSDYHYRHEPLLYGSVPAEESPGYDEDHAPILYGYTPGGEGRRGRGGECWYGDNKQTTVLEVDRPKASRSHPTMKPVELIERCLANSSLPSHAVYDPFAGSGSTVIAAENLGRRAYCMEIDPGYCDVIVDRWERHTGQEAELIRDETTEALEATAPTA